MSIDICVYLYLYIYIYTHTMYIHICIYVNIYEAFLVVQMVKNTPAMQEIDPGFDLWVRNIPWRTEWLPTPVFLPGEFHGERSLSGGLLYPHNSKWGFPRATSSKRTHLPMEEKSHGFNPWVRKIPWRRAWQSTPAFSPGESHAQRSLAADSPQGHTESDSTKAT